MLFKLCVALACDTEDNHPNYVPGWQSCGSNYDLNPAKFMWNWTRYWRDLSELFRSKNVPVTWLVRVDDGPMRNVMLQLFRDEILELRSDGDEIGIHIHTFEWDPKLFRWIQTIDAQHEAKIVTRSIGMFERDLGFLPLSVRMGWNAMSNEIMRTLDAHGILIDASAIPETYCLGKFGQRDNIYDWSKASRKPYHPNHSDYQQAGNMKILEMPISTYRTSRSTWLATLVNRLSSVKGSSYMTTLLPLARKLNVNPSAAFYISPWWSLQTSKRIIAAYGEEAFQDGIAFLVGFLHPCDILDPQSGDKNLLFEKCVSTVIGEVLALRGIDIEFVTLSKMASIFEKKA
jgi:hypothetical protein